MTNDFPEYQPTEQDHTFGDFLDRLDAGFSHELAHSKEVLDQSGLSELATLLPAAIRDFVGTLWEVYSLHAHGPDPTGQPAT